LYFFRAYFYSKGAEIEVTDVGENYAGEMAADLLGLGVFEGCNETAVGFVRRIPFDNFSIENMDFRFRLPASKRYSNKSKFIEMLCVDSIDAVSKEYRVGEFPVSAGIYVHRTHGRDGELLFLPNFPVRGIRIIVDEDFCETCMKDKVTECFWSNEKPRGSNGPNSTNAELRLAFAQIKRSVEREISSELYYKSKVFEILSLLSQGEGGKARPGAKRLTSADADAVNRPKNIMNERLSDPPTISELARMTGTSAAKLQNDFKSECGRTLHDYGQTIRMAEAMRMIVETDEPLYEIAQRVGCKKNGWFSEIFRKTYGLPPKRYRKLFTENA
jgi:AraC-like DNA-binding protein